MGTPATVTPIAQQTVVSAGLDTLPPDQKPPSSVLSDARGDIHQLTVRVLPFERLPANISSPEKISNSFPIMRGRPPWFQATCSSRELSEFGTLSALNSGPFHGLHRLSLDAEMPSVPRNSK